FVFASRRSYNKGDCFARRRLRPANAAPWSDFPTDTRFRHHDSGASARFARVQLRCSGRKILRRPTDKGLPEGELGPATTFVTDGALRPQRHTLPVAPGTNARAPVERTRPPRLVFSILRARDLCGRD